MVNITHGQSATRLYKVWGGMIERCRNRSHKSYKYYGGRGITVTPEWFDWLAFRDWALSHGYKEGLELDRERNNEGYGPGNCRWVTHKQNANNRRDSRLITAFGETKTIAEWLTDTRCKLKSWKQLKRRIEAGENPETAIGTGKRSKWRPGPVGYISHILGK